MSYNEIFTISKIMNKTLLMSSISTLLLPLLFVPIMPMQQAKAGSLYGTWSQITITEQAEQRRQQEARKAAAPNARKVAAPKARAVRKKGNY